MPSGAHAWAQQTSICYDTIISLTILLEPSIIGFLGIPPWNDPTHHIWNNDQQMNLNALDIEMTLSALFLYLAT